MLQLQRASAGSGKTYTLAKKFIEYYISEPDEAGRRRLRPARALRESLQHILAITFTNKATNEMKLRIVDKLNALASWTPAIPIKKVDYLKDFTEQFECSPEELASLCKYALKVLLTDYSDFKVSTIDSFFQTVLRTFAYEADLDDTYQIELDSNYVTQMGLDTTLDEIDTEEKSSQGAVWIESMMENKAAAGKGWNIFQKSQSRSSVYSEILNASRNLAKEDFKEIRESLDAYFEEHPDFFHTYHQLCNLYEKKLRDDFSKMRIAAQAVKDAFIEVGLDMNETAGTYLASRVTKMAETWKWDHRVDKDKTADFDVPEFTRKGAKSRVFHPGKENPHLGTSIEDHIEGLAIHMFKCYKGWRNEALSDKIKRWRLYRTTMPYVGLLQSVRSNSRLFLTDSNTVELGETNSILSRIIGTDDAPFVYERLGSRLEHFLIDEFQDTSNLQWHNLRPLLKESEAKGNDNLIIGDAKQSIYRFRNADPTLITSKVPQEFSGTCKPCGYTPAENTNWRSCLRIVKFNNLFFRFFSKKLGERMEQLYSNTVQPASHKEQKGYVKIQLFENSSADEDNIPSHFDEIPELIADMLRRGYEMSEIAVLVDTHEQGSMIIERIMLYNLRDDVDQKINFISADSLQAGESPAVQTVLSILEAINSGTNAKLNPKELRKDKGAGDWSKLRADFSFFAMRYPGTPLSELLSRFLKGEYDPNAIQDMLAEMSTTVLPALVENIIQQFIPLHTRQSEAAFLAALQDMVLEFCEGHTSDIASFLQWWNKIGRFKSISSPEDADAVNIMTVHKSKGLEFRCVIVPFSKQTVKPSPFQKEWLWVKPDLSEAEGIPQIPWIPIWSESNLKDTIHMESYQQYLDNFMSDKVNMAYVAYTRAIDELYIYTPCKLKEDGSTSDKDRIGSFLWECGVDAENIISDIKNSYSDSIDYIPSADEIIVDIDNRSWTYGEPLRLEEIIEGRKQKDDSAQNIIVSDYRCGANIPALVYKDPTSSDNDLLPADPQEEDIPEAESEEIRRYGELMHSIMENIQTDADIPRALLKAKSAGLIGHKQMETLNEQLKKALESVKSYGWFAPECRVINERGIVVDGKIHRPDRIMIRPDGTAVIVDYKFGEHRNDKAYSRQVKRYASALLQTGKAKKCEAYIWYVSLGCVVRDA